MSPRHYNNKINCRCCRRCLEQQTEIQSSVVQKISTSQGVADRRGRRTRRGNVVRRAGSASVDANTVEQNGGSPVASQCRQRRQTVSDPAGNRLRHTQFQSGSKHIICISIIVTY